MPNDCAQTSKHVGDRQRETLWADVQRLTARVKELEEALRPFADTYWPDLPENCLYYPPKMRVGDFRLARDVLRGG